MINFNNKTRCFETILEHYYVGSIVVIELHFGHDVKKKPFMFL